MCDMKMGLAPPSHEYRTHLCIRKKVADQDFLKQASKTIEWMTFQVLGPGTIIP